MLPIAGEVLLGASVVLTYSSVLPVLLWVAAFGFGLKCVLDDDDDIVVYYGVPNRDVLLL